ncbi:MAG: hypothetical protein V4723_15625 [Pseudomonadota bacterium]
MARVGGSLWLLRHELRMYLFNTMSFNNKEGKRGINKGSMASLAFVWISLHVLMYFLLTFLKKSGEPQQVVVIGVTLVMAGLMTLMMSSGLKASVEVLFERADLDLLLSSPLPSRSIFTVRLASNSFGIAAVYLFFMTPLAHAGLLLGQFTWLGIYPAIASMALIAASLSMLMTLGLVKWLGVRRTRVIAQVLGALAGASLFLISQAANLSKDSNKDAWFAAKLAVVQNAEGMLGPQSLLWYPARGALGAPLPAVLLALAGVAAFLFTVHYTHRFFVRGVQQAVSAVRVAKRPQMGLTFTFGRSLTRTVIAKEWRLIARDPNLISQVLLQLLYMLPILLLFFSKGKISPGGIAASLAFLTASLTAALGWIIMSAEEAPDLLRAAPCKQSTVRNAKLAAVIIPGLLLSLLPLLWHARKEPAQALLMLAIITGASFSAALVVMWCGRPSARGDFKSRGKGNVLASILEALVAFSWSGMGFCLLSIAANPDWSSAYLIGAGVAALVAICLLGAARRFRYKPG